MYTFVVTFTSGVTQNFRGNEDTVNQVKEWMVMESLHNSPFAKSAAFSTPCGWHFSTFYFDNGVIRRLNVDSIKWTKADSLPVVTIGEVDPLQMKTTLSELAH